MVCVGRSLPFESGLTIPTGSQMLSDAHSVLNLVIHACTRFSLMLVSDEWTLVDLCYNNHGQRQAETNQT